jgi:signal transduction histidine kinase
VIRRASRAAEQLVGAKVLHSSFDDIFEITLNSGAACFLKEILEAAGGSLALRNLEASALLPDGRTIEVLLSAAMLAGDGTGAPGCVLTLIDITERKRRERRQNDAERAARESHATLQSFYDSSSFLMGVAELDGDGVKALYGNRAATEFFPREIAAPTETAGKVWLEHYRRSLVTGASVHFEYEHPGVRGSRWLSVAVNYLENGPERKRRFSFVGEDITEKRTADDRLRHTNDELRRANADLEQFAFSASHDLQEPLRQVAVFSQLLEQEYGPRLDGPGLQYLGYCVEGAQRIQKLLHDLLDYSRSGTAEAGVAELVDTNDILSGVRDSLATAIEENGATLTVGQLPAVYFPPVPLALLFQNLISNALKYRGKKPPEVTVSAAREDNTWKFSVRDNGIGIQDEFHQQIFGLFKRLHTRGDYPGTGIGLAICQKIVERQGGRIWVESNPGEGSDFLFTLPAAI